MARLKKTLASTPQAPASAPAEPSFAAFEAEALKIRDAHAPAIAAAYKAVTARGVKSPIFMVCLTRGTGAKILAGMSPPGMALSGSALLTLDEDTAMELLVGRAKLSARAALEELDRIKPAEGEVRVIVAALDVGCDFSCMRVA